MVDFPSLSDVVRVKPAGLYRSEAHEQASKGFPGISIPSDGLLGDLLRVPIDYVLELRVGGVLFQTLALPSKPNFLNYKRGGGQIVEYTLEGVQLHPWAIRRLDIVIAGRTGVEARTGYNRFGQIIFKDPMTIQREFDAFLDLYVQWARSAPQYDDPDSTEETKAELILRCFEERIHVKVNVDGWEVDRNAEQTRMGATWTLRLHAYAAAVPDKPKNLLGPVADAALYAAAMIDTMNAAVAAADNLLVNTRRDLEVLKAPFDALRRTATVVSNTIGSARDLANFPADLAASIVGAWDALVGAFSQLAGDTGDRGGALESAKLSDVEDDGPGSDTALADFIELSMAGQIEAVTAVGLLGGGPRLLSSALVDPDQGSSPYVMTGSGGRSSAWEAERGFVGNVIPYMIRPGDTPRRLSSRLFGSPEGWALVMRINGLSGPWEDENGRPLEPGDRLLVPGAASSDGSMATRGRADLREVWGRDVYLTPGGRWEVTGDKLDVRLVWGSELLEQSLRKRLTTTQGGSVHFPQYGLPVVLGSKLTGRMVLYAAAHMREQILRDPRVVDVEALGVVDDGDGLGVSARIIPRVGEVIPVVAPVFSR